MNQAEALEILSPYGASADSDGHTLKTAYRKAMRSAHPDVGGSTEKAQQVGSAYEFLKSLGPKPSPQGMPPLKPDFENLSYVKQYFDELDNGHPKQSWTIMNFDGHFFRGMFTIRANIEMMNEVVRVMRIWDRFYDSRAIMAGTRPMLEAGKLRVVSIKGYPELEFDSMNLNPANDQQFSHRLPDILDSLEKGDTITEMADKKNWFDTLNDALESEGLVDKWPLGKNIVYGETGEVVKDGTFITVYRDDNGRYERPVHYATKREDTHL